MINIPDPHSVLSSVSLEDIEKEIQDLLKSCENIGLFSIMSANAWIEQAKARPIPKMLFAELWFEGELCILFADTNLGKSILAVQIADSITKGVPIKGFNLEAQRQSVLYFDFEMSDKQFENRYSIEFEHHYLWNDQFLRVEINPDSPMPENLNFEDYLNISLEKAIIETKSKILIIDNITYLKNETERAKDALPLMKHIKALKKKYGLSVLALAHTPKRDMSKPITRNDLSGSKMLMNFCDSSFAIGESSTDKSIRYIKQIKARNTSMIYDTDNVCVCHIDKPHNFLLFEFLHFGNEFEHLKQLSLKDKTARVNEVAALKKQGLSNVEIAEKYQVSEGAVRKWLKKAMPDPEEPPF